MKADRDSFIIILTFVPIAVALVLFLLWKATGNGPFDLPSMGTFGISLPNVSVDDIPGAVGLVKLVQRSTGSAKSVAIGIGLGLFIGLFAAGVLLDVTRSAKKVRLARQKRDGDKRTAL